MSDIRDLAMRSNAWPFEEARKILERIKSYGDRPVLFETGYGPSGLPHIGTFAEVARTTMVMKAFRCLSDHPTKLIVFSDDLDGFRSVPTNVPNQEMLKEYLGFPLTSVPDPFGNYSSFGESNNAKLMEFLDSFGFDYEFASSTSYYKSGRFNETLLKVLQNYDAICSVILPTLGEERRSNYSPFMPICQKTGKVLQTNVVDHDLESITYLDAEGNRVKTLVTDGRCKLQWKVDWAMRWVALGVDYEMSGKDLIDSVKLSTKIARIIGGNPPVGYTYELFLDKEGKKISKSKGNGISVEDWMENGTKNSLSLFMFQKPREAKKIFSEVIPRMEDEYLSHSVRWFNQAEPERLGNPLFFLDGPVDVGGLTYSLLLNLVSAANTTDIGSIWAYIQKHSPGLSPESHPYLNVLVNGAIHYYKVNVEPTKVFRQPSLEEKVALVSLREHLLTMAPESTAEEIQSMVLHVGRQYPQYHDFKAKTATPERPGVSIAWFQALYEILFGQSHGPRMGQFISLFGIQETCKMITNRLEEK